MKIALAVMVAAMFAFGATHAAEKAKEVVKADTKEAFESVAADVRKEMDVDGRYAYVRPDERTKIEASLTEMSALFDANNSVDRMDPATKVKLFNAQEVVNSVLVLRDRDRLICERGAPAGSRIVSTTCHTYGELEAAQQASRRFMEQKTAAPCNSKACTGN